MSVEQKLLAEWFWIDRWDGSSASALPIHARGLYREMLTQAWRRGAKLPTDPEQIQRLCRVTSKEWKRCWPLVRSYWRLDGLSLVNDTQLEIYAESLARAEGGSVKGRKGAEARWRRMPEQCPSNAQASPRALPEQCPPSLSLSPSLSESPSDSLQERFDEFWGAYPKKVGKDAAKRAFEKRKPDADLLESMLSALSVQKRSSQWQRDNGQYIPHPSTWLNEGRWQDEPERQGPTLIGGARSWSWSDCSHEPHCGSAGKCIQQTETDAWKAQQAAS